MEILTEISTMMQRGKVKDVLALVQQALDDGVDAKTILDDALLSAMGVVGDKFKNNLVFVPEVLIAARAMNKGIEILKPYLSDENNEPKGKIILGTVKGDLHDIGKNLVKIMMEGKGIEVIDLGVDVPSERFVEAAKEYNVKLICCSALLTTTMGEMKNVVNLVNADKDLAGKAKVMIGGAPVTQAFCDEIGANIFTDDAASAAEVALQNLN
ncbi:corrinoid protein [Anaerorhabdus sp.]|jgi:methanogenic corrinoid protein MtbC1|uniref:corrinoid protein n=1 Tax=Anaerorhabdus sp. TaxID=1872524 RepID=UPI002FCB6BF5